MGRAWGTCWFELALLRADEDVEFDIETDGASCDDDTDTDNPDFGSPDLGLEADNGEGVYGNAVLFVLKFLRRAFGDEPDDGGDVTDGVVEFVDDFIAVSFDGGTGAVVLLFPSLLGLITKEKSFDP